MEWNPPVQQWSTDARQDKSHRGMYDWLRTSGMHSVSEPKDCLAVRQLCGLRKIRQPGNYLKYCGLSS
jgi:hypothetical protein